MTLAEFELVCIGMAIFAASTFILKQDPKRNLMVFLLACLTGVAAQIPLGRALNLYTPNVGLYFFDISLFVITTWGIGLLAVYSAFSWVVRRWRIRPGALLFFLCTLPTIIVMEFIGSNVLHAKLHNYSDYAPLMPAFNSMHAPGWLYGYYAVIQFLFFLLLKKLGLETEVPVRSPAIRAVGEAPPTALEEYD